MTTRFRSCLFLFASLASAADPSYRIAGVVVDGVTGSPIANCRMSTFSQPRTLGAAAGPEVSIVTKADGRFSFDVEYRGKQSLFAQRNGWPRQTYRADNPGSVGVAVVTGPDQETDNLRFRYYPVGAIYGRVLDEHGEAIEYALVQVIRRAVIAGKRRFVPAGYNYTNDLGEFRFGQLQAGTYYLAVTAHAWQADYSASIRQPGLPVPSFAPQYFPATPDPSAAEPIPLAPGDQVPVNFSLRSVAGYTVTVERPAESTQKVILSLIREGVGDTESYQIVREAISVTTPLPAVPPGRYLLRATRGEGQQADITNQTIDVQQDVTVKLDFGAISPVTGTVVIKDGDPKDISRLIVVLRQIDGTHYASRQVTKDGSFTMPRLTAGKYRATIGGAGYFAEDERIIELTPCSQPPLSLTAMKGSGRVSGILTRDGKPLPGASVILAPQNPSPDDVRFRLFYTDSDGSFDLLNIHPGDYTLIATTDQELEYINPTALRPYLVDGKTMHIDAGSSFSERLEVK